MQTGTIKTAYICLLLRASDFTAFASFAEETPGVGIVTLMSTRQLDTSLGTLIRPSIKSSHSNSLRLSFSTSLLSDVRHICSVSVEKHPDCRQEGASHARLSV
jgi:hypothetical protein